MSLTIVILSIIVVWLLFKRLPQTDYRVAFENRKKMLRLAREEYKQGIISMGEYMLWHYLFHIDFKNIFDYTPMEEAGTRAELEKLDSNFWKSYKITPDYVIPSDFVFGLYKEFVVKNIENYPLVKKKYNL